MNILTKAKAVHFDDQYLRVELEDGRVILTPMAWYAESKFVDVTSNSFIVL